MVCNPWTDLTRICVIIFSQFYRNTCNQRFQNRTLQLKWVIKSIHVPRLIWLILQTYCKSNIALDDNTTYKLSYWGCPLVVTNPMRQEGCLAVGDGPTSDETTHKVTMMIVNEMIIFECTFLGQLPRQLVFQTRPSNGSLYQTDAR